MDAATSDSGSGNPPLKRRRIVRKIKGNEGEGTESSDEEKCDAGKGAGGKKPVADQECYIFSGVVEFTTFIFFWLLCSYDRKA